MPTPVTLRQPRLTVLHVIRRAVMTLIYIQVWDQAASMTFFTLLSIAPLLVSLVSIISLTGVEDSVLRGISDVATVLFPAVDPDALTRSLHGLTPDGGTVVGVVLGSIGTLIAASNAVAAFHRSMHRIYDTREGRQFLPFRAIVLLETIVLLVAIAAAFLMITVGGELALLLGDVLGLDRAVVAAWDVLRWPLLLFVLALYVNIAYYMGPNVHLPRFGLMSAGSLVSTAGLFGMAVLLGWLTTISSEFNDLLGTLNGVLILLVLAWFANIVLIAGAALDAELLRARQLAIGLRAWDRIDLRPRNRWTLDFLQDDRRQAARLGRIVASSARDDEPRRLPRSLWLTEATRPMAITGTPEIRAKLLAAADEDRSREAEGESGGASAQEFREALVRSWSDLRSATSRVVRLGRSGGGSTAAESAAPPAHRSTTAPTTGPTTRPTTGSTARDDEGPEPAER